MKIAWIWLAFFLCLTMPSMKAFTLGNQTEICFSTTSGCYKTNNDVDMNETIVYEDAVYYRNLFRPKIYNVTGSVYMESLCFPYCNLTAPTANTTIRFDVGDSSLSLTSSNSWSLSVGQSTTITCTADGNLTKTLYRNGITVSNPYSTTPTYGTYNYTCAINDTTGRFTPTSSQNTLTVAASGFGCTNANTYAFEKTIYPTTTNVSLNFTDLVNNNYVNPNMTDVVNTTNVPNIWINVTGGNYLIVNTTGVSSFTVRFGNYYVGSNTYTEGNVSDTTVSMTTYTEINPYYFFTFMDEKNATQWLPSGTNNTMSIYCTAGETTFNITNSSDTQMLVATVQQLDEAKIRVEYSPTSFYYRNLLMESDVEFNNFYVVDATRNTVLQMVMTMQDLTGDFDNAILKVKKNIESNLETITELNFDAENKAIVYLVDGDKYSIYVDSGTEERNIGYLYADSSDLTKTVVIGELNTTNMTIGNISLSLTYSGGTVTFTWYDPSNQTNLVEFWVYNYTTDAELYHASSTNRSSVNFNYITPYENATYKVKYLIHHETYGNNTFGLTTIIKGIGVKTRPQDAETFPLTALISGMGGGSVGSNSSNTWMALLLILPIPLLFNKRFGVLGTLAMLAICGLFAYWEIYPLVSVPIAVGLFLTVIGVVKWARREE